MKEGPSIASVAALIGDPARSNMLTALMDGRALTVTELADAAGVALPTASGHLARLNAAGLLTAEKQGRHRYFRLSGADVGDLLERLMGVAQRTGTPRVRTGPRNEELRQARICYDHLAGERGVAMLDALTHNGLVAASQDLVLTDIGRDFFEDFGIAIDRLEEARRPICRACLDWSERRSHLAGSLGAAILNLLVERDWVRRTESRVLLFTPDGNRAFAERFSLLG